MMRTELETSISSRPDKAIVPASRVAVCAFMNQSTPRKVYQPFCENVHEITVPCRTLASQRVDTTHSLHPLIPKEFPFSGRNSPTVDFPISH